MNENIIGIDFSLNKPCACVYANNQYSFYAWPYDINKKTLLALKEAGVNVIDRIETRDKLPSSSDKVRHDITNSSNLATLIIDTLKPFINNKTIFSFEGSSFGSSGNIALQLTAYRYILIYKLTELIDVKNIYNYSPMTLKSIAGCSERGKKKEDMIRAFISLNIKSPLTIALKEGKLKKPKCDKWIDNVDDLIDSYYALECFREKER